MPDAKKVDLIMGGDPTMLRASMLDPGFAASYQRTEAARSIEVPCQRCGRGVLLAPSGQRIALGDPARVVELDKDALAENRIAAAGEAETVAGGAAVVCMWCAFARFPDAIASLDAMLARARRALGLPR